MQPPSKVYMIIRQGVALYNRLYLSMPQNSLQAGDTVCEYILNQFDEVEEVITEVKIKFVDD
jgi:hypothetical protein